MFGSSIGDSTSKYEQKKGAAQAQVDGTWQVSRHGRQVKSPRHGNDQSNPPIALCTLLRVSTGYGTCSCIVIWHITGGRTGRGHRVTPLRKRGWRSRSCGQVRVPPIIKYKLLLNRLHPSILPHSFA